MSISNKPLLQDLKQLTYLNETEKTNIKGGYLFSCEEKKRNLMNISVFSDEGVLIETIKGVTATNASSVMTTYGTAPVANTTTLRKA